MKYLTKNFEKLDNFAEKNAEGVIITPKKGLYETLDNGCIKKKVKVFWRPVMTIRSVELVLVCNE